MIRNTKIIVGMGLVFLLLSMGGCNSAPVYNVSDAPIVVSSRNYNLTDVKNAILRAGNALGWQMQESGEQRIEGTLRTRNRMARIDVSYDKNTYSIQYKDSASLSYDGTEINNDYNDWIRWLDDAIRSQLLTI